MTDVQPKSSFAKIGTATVGIIFSFVMSYVGVWVGTTLSILLLAVLHLSGLDAPISLDFLAGIEGFITLVLSMTAGVALCLALVFRWKQVSPFAFIWAPFFTSLAVRTILILAFGYGLFAFDG